MRIRRPGDAAGESLASGVPMRQLAHSRPPAVAVRLLAVRCCRLRSDVPAKAAFPFLLFPLSATHAGHPPLGR